MASLFCFARFFLHSARNFLRSLPCRPFASASFEHWIDSGEWTTGVAGFFASFAKATPLPIAIMAAAAAATNFIEVIVCAPFISSSTSVSQLGCPGPAGPIRIECIEFRNRRTIGYHSAERRRTYSSVRSFCR
ncbi:hypothetical protein HYPGJ_31904 [Hyphomicrobium sp. GJ21]|nr:hypothetical protein HYPGJ_31904 [Hyphomicrobium sp. GJ21]